MYLHTRAIALVIIAWQASLLAAELQIASPTLDDKDCDGAESHICELTDDKNPHEYKDRPRIGAALIPGPWPGPFSLPPPPAAPLTLPPNTLPLAIAIPMIEASGIQDRYLYPQKEDEISVNGGLTLGKKPHNFSEPASCSTINEASLIVWLTTLIIRTRRRP